MLKRGKQNVLLDPLTGNSLAVKQSEKNKKDKAQAYKAKKELGGRIKEVPAPSINVVGVPILVEI